MKKKQLKMQQRYLELVILVDVLKTISEMEFESIKAFSSAVAGMNSMKEAIHTVKDLDDALVELKKSSEK